jgi:hypothetical protein
MSTRELTPSAKATIAVGCLVVLAMVVVAGLLLREHGPGNMGAGFLWGAAVGLVGVAIMAWRVGRPGGDATTFERAWLQSGDERDDAVLTRALAVLGLVALPLTGIAAIAIALGAHVAMVMCLLLVAQLAVGAVAFWKVNRQS